MLGDKSDWVGSVDARIPDLLIGSDQVAFRSAVGRMSDAYRKLITGAGASNLEIQKLESRLPQPTDTFANFQSKAKSFIKEVERARTQHLSNLQKVGKNVEPFKSTEVAAPSNEVERKDPKSGKTAIFNAETKQFLRWKGE